MVNFENSFKTLPKYLYEEVKATPLKNPKLIHISKLNLEIGLGLSDEELMRWLNGEMYLAGEERIASRYAGHQFGVWAGQLGDGRAISIGEIKAPNGNHYEIQTKGSGLTPFSRMGDGKAVIRSSVREYLCSEAMHGLKIPTTRVLALITGEDDVRRETMERSALVARVFPSNLRFGHFELCFHFERHAELDALIQYTNQTFFAGLSIEEMLREIIARTAKLMACWQSVGFCHGVMNTDNMSVLGLTIDYGPFGFLEDTVLNYICNHSDHQGRYAYNKQPSVAMWNLERLLICFMDKVPKVKLQELLNDYHKVFEAEYLRMSMEKLGLEENVEGDWKLFVELLQTMNHLSFDYTFLFRQLSHYKRGEDSSLKNIWDYYGQREEFKSWLKLYDERLKKEKLSDDERHSKMLIKNPKYVLKNYIAQEIITDVEAGNNMKLNNWLEVLDQPFAEHPEFHAYSNPTPPEQKDFSVSCSS